MFRYVLMGRESQSKLSWDPMIEGNYSLKHIRDSRYEREGTPALGPTAITVKEPPVFIITLGRTPL